MDKKYKITKATKATMYFVKYNIVFCTRCNRKVFKNDMARDMFRNECFIVCEYLDVKLNTINTYDYYVHIIVEANPKFSANEIIQKIKMHTSKILRENIEELKRLPSLWTREYLVTTENELEDAMLNSFLVRQKK